MPGQGAAHALECQLHSVYTSPGLNWRPSACEADVMATRPEVLAMLVCEFSFRCLLNVFQNQDDLYFIIIYNLEYGFKNSRHSKSF